MLTAAEQNRLAAELVALRAARVPWKTLVSRFGLGRARLNQLWRAARVGVSIDTATIDEAAPQCDAVGSTSHTAAIS
jgi:hypothetical protein